MELFPPFVSGKYAVPLASFDDMVPGDAVNKTFRNPYGHVMLFAGWASANHSQLYFMHHSKTGTPVALDPGARSGLGDSPRSARSTRLSPTEAAPPPVNQTLRRPPRRPRLSRAAACSSRARARRQRGDDLVRRAIHPGIQQGDGNLVLYQNGVEALWSSGTTGTPAQVTVMQGDGNLVTYTADSKPRLELADQRLPGSVAPWTTTAAWSSTPATSWSGGAPPAASESHP